VSRLERIISGSVRLKIVSLKPQHMWSHNNNLPGTEYFNCCLSSSSSLKVTWRDFVCQCGPSLRGRCGLLLFNSADVVHAPTSHQKGETHNNRKKYKKKTNITIYGQATHIFTPAPTPAWKTDGSATVSPRYLYFLWLLFYIYISSACRYRVVLPPFGLLADND
jgi:hypothetical protein